MLLLLLFEPFVVEGRTWRSQATVVGQKNVSLVLPIGFFFSSRLFESELSTELLTFFSSAVRHFQQRAFMLGPFNRRLKTTWCGILYQKEKKEK